MRRDPHASSWFVGRSIHGNGNPAIMNPENPAQRPIAGRRAGFQLPRLSLAARRAGPDHGPRRNAGRHGREGRSERETLRNIVQRFKSLVAGHTVRGEPIPGSKNRCQGSGRGGALRSRAPVGGLLARQRNCEACQTNSQGPESPPLEPRLSIDGATRPLKNRG